MFDLWGEAMPVPMPSLDLPAADVSLKEKLAWERELMGVYLSEHPFSTFAGKAALETTLCGQINAEMAGQTVIVAGMVASVHHLFTRDHHPFVNAILEDLDGRVEVMVWPKTYTNTKDLWQEGNILLVTGKIRLRDDRVQLNCDNVRHYQLEDAHDNETVTSAPTETLNVTEETLGQAAPAKRRRLVISLSQTSDEGSDVAHLQKLIDILNDFPGQDEVNLCVVNEEKVINLKLPKTYTNYCPRLHQRLVELVGEDKIRIERTDSA